MSSRTCSGLPNHLASNLRSEYLTRLAEERGVRLRIVRQFVGLTLEEFSKVLEWIPGTAGRIERGQSCLSISCADWIQNKLMQKLGLIVRKEWLLFGKKNGPEWMTNRKEFDIVDFMKKVLAQENVTIEQEMSENFAVFLEIEVFKRVNRTPDVEPVVTLVRDNKMQPIFSKGDYVGGVPLSKGNYHLADGLSCIIEFKPDAGKSFAPYGTKLVRKVSVFADDHIVLLSQDMNKPMILRDEPILLVPIIWSRKTSVSTSNFQMTPNDMFSSNVEEEVEESTES